MDAAATLAAQGANKMDSSPLEEDPFHLVRTYIYISTLYLHISHLWGKQGDKEDPSGSILLESASVFGIGDWYTHLCLVSVKANKKTWIFPRDPLHLSGILLLFCII